MFLVFGQDLPRALYPESTAAAVSLFVGGELPLPPMLRRCGYNINDNDNDNDDDDDDDER